jgi:hypothetical protein
MAFVGITAQMCHEVRQNIKSMRDAELKQLGESPAQSIQLTGDEPWLKDAVWEGRTDLIGLLPSHWFGNPEFVDFAFYADLGTGKDKHIASKRVREFNKFPLPPMYKNSSYPTVTVKFGTNVPEFLKDTVSYSEKYSDIEQRWSKVTDNVNKFISNCKSLNEALKLWPDLRVYIPRYYMDRVNKKPERKEKQESNAAAVLAEINTDEIHASAVIARMSGAII